MPQVSIEMTLAEAQAIQALRNVVREQDKTEAGWRDMAKEAKQAEKAEQELGRTAQRVLREIQTPQEKFNAKVQELDTLLAKGKLSQEQFGLAARKAHQDAFAGTEQAVRGVETLSDSIGAAVGGYIGLAAAVGIASKAIADFDAKAEESAAKQQQAKMGVGSLAQMAKDPEDMRKLYSEAEAIFKSGGAENMDQAARIVFAASSAGERGEAPLMGQMKRVGLVATPDEMMKAAATLKTSMGEDETGTVRDLFSKAFGASQYSPATAESLLQGAARAGTGAKALGLKDEEVLAATAITASATGSAEEGGTQLKALMTSLQRMGAPSKPGEKAQFDFKGDDLRTMLREIESAKMDEGQLLKTFGSDEALSAYRVLLANEETYKQALQSTVKAQRDNELGKRLEYFKEVPELASAVKVADATAAEEMSRKEMGRIRNESEAILKDMETNMRESGVPEAVTWTTQKLARGVRLGAKAVGAEEAFVIGSKQPGSMIESARPRTRLSKEAIEFATKPRPDAKPAPVAEPTAPKPDAVRFAPAARDELRPQAAAKPDDRPIRVEVSSPVVERPAPADVAPKPAPVVLEHRANAPAGVPSADNLEPLVRELVDLQRKQNETAERQTKATEEVGRKLNASGAGARSNHIDR